MKGHFIIAKALNRAIHCGYPYKDFNVEYAYVDGNPDWTGYFIMTPDVGQPVKKHYLDILFDHEFARTLWGEAPVPPADGSDDIHPLYYFQMQMMVVNKDRIKFLEENL